MTDEILNIRVLGEISAQLGHDTTQMLLNRYADAANALMTLLNSQQGKDALVEDLIKDIHKTALGATESVDWEYHKEAAEVVKQLKDKKIIVYAIEQAEGALSLENFKITPNEKYAFVLGNEVKGVSQTLVNLCDGVIEIPQEGTKHSLNISVASGVVLWDFYQKFKNMHGLIRR